MPGKLSVSFFCLWQVRKGMLLWQYGCTLLCPQRGEVFALCLVPKRPCNEQAEDSVVLPLAGVTVPISVRVGILFRTRMRHRSCR
jgi:hypothetical protein